MKTYRKALVLAGTLLSLALAQGQVQKVTVSLYEMGFKPGQLQLKASIPAEIILRNARSSCATRVKPLTSARPT